MKYNPFDYAVIDIETLDADEETLAFEESLLKPSGACKYEKSKKESLAKKKAELRDKAALQDSSPIGCVGIKSLNQTAIFCNFPLSSTDVSLISSMGIWAVSFIDEKAMLLGSREYLERAFTTETALVSHNGENFDFPKLRGAYSRYNLRHPFIFHNFHRDLMLWYPSKYSTRRNGNYVSLEEIMRTLGIAEGKLMEGAMFPRLIEWGHETGNSIYFVLGVVYNALDLYLTEQVYYRLHPDIGQ